MCGRYSLEFDDGFYKRYGLSAPLDIKTNYNVAPNQVMPVAGADGPGTAKLMKWGLIPPWEEQLEKPKGLINLRSDTITTKKWAMRYIQHNRCLVPATGFYEWKRDSLGKHPYYFYLKNKRYYSFAGVYSENTNTYSLITTSANELMRPIHDRLPVILADEQEEKWIDRSITDIDTLSLFLNPYQPGDMAKYPVSEKINAISYTAKPGKATSLVQESLL